MLLLSIVVYALKWSATYITFDMTVPFLKWVGGKRWMINSGQFPEISSYNRYIEPFLGGAAIFFYLKPEIAILSDINENLIETYEVLRDHHLALESLLQEYQNNHCKDFYYKIRKSSSQNRITRAAKLIYLNRTCWNGLYRVNKKGQFNVPIGTRSSVLRKNDDFFEKSLLLKSAKILCCDFEETIDSSLAGDLLFVDPPYTVKHNYNNFIKYNEKIFSWQDQIRLRNCLLRAKKRGVQIIMTNACHECVKELYEDIGTCISANRVSSLASKASNRKSTTEAIFTVNIHS